MKLELSEDGNLYRITEGARSAYDFNEEYRGYYAPCRFTALCDAGGQILLAGLDDAGWPHLFLSLMGTAFEERPLVAASPVSPPKRLRGEIFRILYEEEENQYYLVCRNGEIAVMPDCPKCLRIVSAGAAAFAEAELVTKQPAGGQEAFLILTEEGGQTREIPLASLRQYRVSWSFAEKLVQSGALLVDVRDIDLGSFLQEQPRQQVLIFLCRTGHLADEAAEFARARGYYRAFSAGGTEDWAHVE